MIEFAWAIFYGFIQGVTEFLPVSSSGHLALIPYFFDLKDPGVVFDLLMHLGTAIAVIIYFNSEIKRLINEGLMILMKRDFKNTAFFQNFCLATFFSFVLILILKEFALDKGRQSIIIGINFIVFGILMYISDRVGRNYEDLTKNKSFKKSMLIGLSQSLAIFPGVSRSGITLTTSRFLGLSRLEASRFSFLLSLPVIIGSIIFKIPDIAGGEVSASATMMVVGVFSSFIFGILTIHLFLKIIARVGLGYFALYRVLLGSVLIYLYLNA